MADCSRTAIFCSELKRMCYYYHMKTPDNPCYDCPIKYDGCDITTRGLLSNGLIEIVQMWSDRHPAPKPKTYLDYFYECFPLARKTIIGIPCICRRQLFDQGRCDTTDENCDCVKCWNEPYKESEKSL